MNGFWDVLRVKTAGCRLGIVVLGLLSSWPAFGLPREAVPPTYHKVSLNGRPLWDELPQVIARTDEEPEQSFVDALTLAFRHATTDIYVTLAQDLPQLAVRRNVQSACWPREGGLSPEKRPDLPFGACWTSGLAASVHLIEGGAGEPLSAEVMDDAGMVHSFIEVTGPDGAPHFSPVPSANNEQETTAMSLEKKDGAFVLRRKFGATLVYPAAGGIEVAEPGAEPRKHTYYRLATVSNRAGSKFSYVFYGGNHGLVPDEIAYLTQRVHIERNERGQVARLVDPNGGDIFFTYREPRQPGSTPLLVWVTCQEINGKRDSSFYEYDEAAEPGADGKEAFYHCDLGRIADARGKTYELQYAFDTSCGERGLPRWVHKVILPDGVGTTEFFSLTKRNADESRSVRMTYVRDAAGNSRLYRFLDPSTVAFGPGGGKAGALKFAVVGKIEVSNFQGAGDAASLKNGEIAGTKMLARETFEFAPGTCMGLVRTTDASGNILAFTYGDPGFGSALVDENPFAQRRRDVTEYRNALGAKKEFAYDETTRILARTVDENGRVMENEVDPKRGLITATRFYASDAYFKAKAPCAETLFEYAHPAFPAFMTKKIVKSIPTTETPPWETDLVTAYEPDAVGLVAREIRNPGGLNLSLRYGFDRNGNKLFVVYPDGYSILFTYDARNRLVRVDRPQDNKPPRVMVYDGAGNKIRETDADGTVTDMEYDGVSRLVKKTVTGKELQVFAYVYNAVGSKLYDTTDEGKTYSQELDGLQRVVKRFAEDGTETAFEYGKNSGSDLFESSNFNAIRVAYSPSRKVVLHRYNEGRKRVSMTVMKGVSSPAVTEFSYDPAGNLLLEKEPNGSETQYLYDFQNRLIRTVLPDKTTQENKYTSTGLKYISTNDSGERLVQQFNAAGYVVEKPKE